jgi:hypothetical protein
MIAALPPGGDRQVLSAEMEAIGRRDPNPLGGLRLRGTDDLDPAPRPWSRCSPTGTPRASTGSIPTFRTG